MVDVSNWTAAVRVRVYSVASTSAEDLRDTLGENAYIIGLFCRTAVDQADLLYKGNVFQRVSGLGASVLLKFPISTTIAEPVLTGGSGVLQLTVTTDVGGTGGGVLYVVPP